MSQMRRAGRGRSTPMTLLTRLGPLPARLAPAVLLRAGGLPRPPPLTGRTGRRGTTSGRPYTRSGHSRRRTLGRGFYRLRGSGYRQQPSTGDSSSRKRRARNRIPLFTGPRQTEEQSDEVMQRLGLREGAVCNRRSRSYPQPRVAAILGGNMCLRMIPATPPRSPTPLP